jgi:hypothetical protein
MPARKQTALTMEYIQSSDCTWPETVKMRAVDVIKLTSLLASKRHKLVGVNMNDVAKIELMNEVALLHHQLGRAYTNMSKELVYHISRIPPQITGGN